MHHATSREQNLQSIWNALERIRHETPRATVPRFVEILAACGHSAYSVNVLLGGLEPFIEVNDKSFEMRLAPEHAGRGLEELTYLVWHEILRNDTRASLRSLGASGGSQ